MPTNPNIILSGNQMAAPRLPDVNAMMQTRTAGLENIYNIEQQRAEQAKAAQKEQEAALVEALAPAYATAFKGGGSREAITAAYDLLPPEIQPNVKGQIDRLLAMPSDDLRLSALEASMAGSEMGRTLLDRIPTEIQRMNAEIQRGQLEVSKAELAQRQAEANKPAAGEFATVETDKGIFVINKKTGEIRPATTEGMPGPRAETEGPINVAQPPQVLQPKAKTAEITQTERRAASLLDNVVRNADAVNNVITENPDAFQPSAAEAAAGFLPWGQQQVKAWEQNPQRKIVFNRMRQSIDALLTLATGAAYTQAQLDAQVGAYMPGFFDEDAVKRDKIMALRDRIESEKLNAGRAWTPEQEARAAQVFKQFESIVNAMSTGGEGGGAADSGEVDTSNPLLQD